MKKLFFLLLPLFGMAQSNNYNSYNWNKEQFFKDTLHFEKGITVGYVLYVVDASGKIGFQAASGFTKTNNKIQLVTLTDSVGIGKIPNNPFEVVAKGGGDSIYVKVNKNVFEILGTDDGVGVVSTFLFQRGAVTITSGQNNNFLSVSGDEIQFNAISLSKFSAGNVEIQAGDLDVTGNITCDTLFGVVSTAYSGTYTPTLSNTTNVSASTARLCTYQRVGNMGMIVGQFDIDPTAPGAVVLGISLPPGATSNFTTVYEAGGDAVATGIAGTSGGIQANATTDVLEFRYIAVDLSNQTMSFTAGYEVK